MGAYYDEVEIEDMVWDEEKRVYHYPCPCGDRFEISREQLKAYEDIATCPSCSLVIRIVYDPLDYQDDEEDENDSASGADSPEESENDEEDQDKHLEVSGSEEDSERLQDVFENLHISEHPGTVVVSA